MRNRPTNPVPPWDEKLQKEAEKIHKYLYMHSAQTFSTYPTLEYSLLSTTSTVGRVGGFVLQPFSRGPSFSLSHIFFGGFFSPRILFPMFFTIRYFVQTFPDHSLLGGFRRSCRCITNSRVHLLAVANKGNGRKSRPAKRRCTYGLKALKFVMKLVKIEPGKTSDAFFLRNFDEFCRFREIYIFFIFDSPGGRINRMCVCVCRAEGKNN